jgi:homoserine kinase type II
MAHITRLTDEEARALLAQYGLALEAIEPLPAHGTVNSNYRVRAAGKQWFLRLNEGKTEADVETEVALIDAMRAADVPTPFVVRAQDGRAVLPAKGRPATLFPWLFAHEAEPDPARPRTVEVAGTALGKLHLAGWGRTPERCPRNHYSLAELERRLATFAADPRVADVVPILERELARAHQLPATVAGLIHQDLFPDNVLVDQRGVLVAILDFEQATWGSYVYDLAVAINAWCWNGARIETAAAEALVGAYEAVRRLEPAERRVLVDTARLASARFAITRITDVFLAPGVDPDLARRKDFRDYLRRLEYWVAHA